MALKSIVGKWVDFCSVVQIVSTGCWLLKTVGLLMKNNIFVYNPNPFSHPKNQCFGCDNANNRQNDKCYTPLNSWINFQSIGIQT